VRVGLPLTGGALVQGAIELGAPVLFSASAFMRPWPREERWRMRFPGFRSAAKLPLRLDAALDSAGFVAMKVHNGFPWTVDAYADLAASYPFAWRASMDLACEPQLAADQDEIKLRQAHTVRLYSECRRAFRDRGLADPMPVLQGWRPDDYARHVDRFHIWTWPELVGVGSMCRRHLGGMDDLVAVVDRLDKVLPPHTKLHLFGVKSQGIAALSGHPRVASVDSMAWDMDATATARRGRTRAPAAAMDLFGHERQAKSCTMAHRLDAMRRWYEGQLRRCESRAASVATLLPMLGPAVKIDPWAFPDDLLELIEDGEIDSMALSPTFIMEWIAENMAEAGHDLDTFDFFAA
jgi:hypothetical protein